MNRYVGWVNWALPALGAVALCIMASVTLVDITFRSLFNQPVQGSYEIVQLMLVTAIYAGLGETFRRGVHITVDLIDYSAPRLAKKILSPAAQILSLIVVAVLFFGAIQRGLRIAGYGDTTMDLKLPAWWFWMPVIIGLAWALICIPVRLFSDITGKNK